jgi:hypothetical protein
VTADSGSPARSACVRTRCRPRSRSPSANQSLAAELAHRLERAPRLAGPAPAAFLVGDGRRARRGSSRGRARRGGRAPRRRRRRFPITVVEVRAGHGDDATDEPRAADVRPRGRRCSAALRCRAPSATSVRGPTRSWSGLRSSIVSMSSARFGSAIATAPHCA